MVLIGHSAQLGSHTNQPEDKQPVLLLPLLPKICPDSYCWLSPLSPRGQPQEEPGQGLHLPGCAIGVPSPVAAPSHKGASPLAPLWNHHFSHFLLQQGCKHWIRILLHCKLIMCWWFPHPILEMTSQWAFLQGSSKYAPMCPLRKSLGPSLLNTFASFYTQYNQQAVLTVPVLNLSYHLLLTS